MKLILNAFLLVTVAVLLSGQALANPSVGTGVSNSVSTDKSKSLDVRDSATAQKSSGTRASDSKATSHADAESDSVQNNRSVTVSIDAGGIVIPIIAKLEQGVPIGKQGVVATLSQACRPLHFDPTMAGPAVSTPRVMAQRTKWEEIQGRRVRDYISCGIVHGVGVSKAMSLAKLRRPTEIDVSEKFEQALADVFTDPEEVRTLERIWGSTSCEYVRELVQSAIESAACTNYLGGVIINFQTGAISLNGTPVWGGSTFMGQSVAVAKQDTEAVSVTRTDTKTRSKSTDHYTDGSVAVSKSKSKSASASVKTSKSRSSKADVNAAPTQ